MRSQPSRGWHAQPTARVAAFTSARDTMKPLQDSIATVVAASAAKTPERRVIVNVRLARMSGACGDHRLADGASQMLPEPSPRLNTSLLSATDNSMP